MFEGNNNDILRVSRTVSAPQNKRKFQAKIGKRSTVTVVGGLEQAMIGKKERLEMECRRELKLFFYRNQAGRPAKFTKNSKQCLRTLLHIFKHQSQQPLHLNNQYSLSPIFSSYSAYKQSGALCLKRKLIQSDFPLLLILTTHLQLQGNPMPSFNVEILTFSGKIIYRKNELKNWQSIYQQIHAIKAKFDKVCYLLADRANTVAFIAEQKELTAILQDFIDIQKFGVGNGDTHDGRWAFSIMSSEAKQIEKVIRQYEFIKSQLIRHLGWDGRPISPSESCLIAIINNLLASITLNLHTPLFEQIQPFTNAITRAIQKSIRREKGVTYGQHYPAMLENAQACLKCKRRGYIYCPTCSLLEKKRTTLCLNCYEAHHKQLKQSRESMPMKVVEEWATMNEKVEAMFAFQE